MSEIIANLLESLQAPHSELKKNSIRGFVDPEQSDYAVLFFSLHPCYSDWVRIPTDLIERWRKLGSVTCSTITYPEYELSLKDNSYAIAVIDALNLAAVQPSVTLLSALSSETAYHDIKLALSTYGSIYTAYALIENQEVDLNANGKKYLPNHPISGNLNVGLECTGKPGATGTLNVTVDGKLQTPPVTCKIIGISGSGQQTYKII